MPKTETICKQNVKWFNIYDTQKNKIKWINKKGWEITVLPLKLCNYPQQLMLNKDLIGSVWCKTLPISPFKKTKQKTTTNVHSLDNMSHTHLSLCICPQSSTSNHSCLTTHAPPKEKQKNHSHQNRRLSFIEQSLYLPFCKNKKSHTIDSEQTQWLSTPTTHLIWRVTNNSIFQWLWLRDL